MARSGKLQQTRGSSGSNFLVGMFVGLIVGLAIALGVAFYLNKTPLPFTSKGRPQAAKDGVADPAKKPAIVGLPSGGSPAAAGSPAATGSPAAAAKGDKPRFDFYKILPGGEEPVTDQQLKEQQKAARGQPESSRDVYYIQAGSFQNPADADSQKAKLAIIGLDSSVEPTSLPDKGTWYRVRLGPYSRLDEINRVRQSLAQNGIDASLVKLKDPSSKAP